MKYTREDILTVEHTFLWRVSIEGGYLYCLETTRGITMCFVPVTQSTTKDKPK